MSQTFSTSMIGRGAIWSMINQSVAQILVLVVFLVTARFVSKEAFGIMAVCMMVVEAFKQIAIESVGITLTSKKECDDQTYNAGFAIILVCSALSALLVFFLAGPIAKLLHHDEIASSLRWISLILLTTGLSRTHEAWLVKHLRFKVLALRSMLAICIGGTLGIVMAINGFGLMSLIMQQLVTALISTATLWLTTTWRPNLKTSWMQVKSILNHSRHVATTAAIALVSTQSDTFFSSYYLGASQTGVYNAAKRINLALWMMVSSALNSVALPIQAALHGDREGSKLAFSKCVFMTSCITAPLYMGVAALSPEIIFMLLGDRWSEVAPVLSLLTVIGFFSAITQYHINIMLVYNKPQWLIAVTAINAVANFILFFLVARYGLIVLSGAFLIKTLLFYPVSAVPSLYLLRMSWREHFKDIVTPLFSGIIMGALVYIFSDILGDEGFSPYARLALLVPLGVVIYSGMMLAVDRKSVLELWTLLKQIIINKDDPSVTDATQ